jgi:hypothetical protein
MFPRPRVLLDYENELSPQSKTELDGGDNKMAKELQKLAELQAEGMVEQKNILHDYLIMHYKHMWKTTIAASGEVDEEDVKEFYEPQGVRELNKAIL